MPYHAGSVSYFRMPRRREAEPDITTPRKLCPGKPLIKEIAEVFSLLCGYSRCLRAVGFKYVKLTLKNVWLDIVKVIMVELR